MKSVGHVWKAKHVVDVMVLIEGKVERIEGKVERMEWNVTDDENRLLEDSTVRIAGALVSMIHAVSRRHTPTNRF